MLRVNVHQRFLKLVQFLIQGGHKVAHPGKYENSKDTKIMESFDLDTPSSGKHFEHL